MNNPFAEIYERLGNIEGFLLALDEKLTTSIKTEPDADRWEQGVQVVVEETGLKPQTVYQKISKIPHRKLHGKLYFNRAQLREYIAQEGRETK